MNEQDMSRSRSPFAELSFSQQQEMWRIWRAKPLEYQEIKPAAPKAAPAPPKKTEAEAAPPLPIQPPFAPPSHKNLDRVHARISAAAAKARDFKPLT